MIKNHFESTSVLEYCGAIHLHSTYSDGTNSVAQLIAVASDLGLDYLVLTDHMSLAARNENIETCHGELCCIVGYEHNDSQNKNHYLALNVDSVVEETDNPQEYIDSIKRRGGIGFLAHPFEKRTFFKKVPPYPWTDLSVCNFNGLEIWNQMSDWAEHFTLGKGLFQLVHPRKHLRGAPPEGLKYWDEWNLRRFVAAIGGVDSHSLKFGLGPFSFLVFPLRVELKGVRTHLFLGADVIPKDYQSVKPAILEALKNGCGFISNYRWGDARGAHIYMIDHKKQLILPGRSEKIAEPPATLVAAFTQNGLIRLIRNGVVIETAHGKKVSFTLRRNGVYRLEVFRKKHPWIYTNPFIIGSYPIK